MIPDRENLRQVLVTAALAGGAAILRVRNEGFDVTSKSDASPVTQADKAAEAVITELLTAARPDVFPDIPPDIPIVGEEATSDGYIAPRRDMFFLVDPLDGTREFITGRDEFTVNIALVEDCRPTLGVVYAPPLDELFLGDVIDGVAVKSSRASEALTWEHLTTQPSTDGTLRVLTSRSHSNAETENFLSTLPVARRMSAGSSLKFCRIAEGKADLHPRFGPTNEWDTAAAQAVLTAAGGAVLTFEGDDLVCNQRGREDMPDYRNPNYVAVACTSFFDLFCRKDQSESG